MLAEVEKEIKFEFIGHHLDKAKEIYESLKMKCEANTGKKGTKITIESMDFIVGNTLQEKIRS